MLSKLCERVKWKLWVSVLCNMTLGWSAGGRDNTSKTLCFQPTAHGLPPMMLKPRDPPSRRRTAVTLLVSPSYRQTEKKHMIKETAGRGFEIIRDWLQLSNRRTEPSIRRRRRIQQEKSLSTPSSIQSIIYLINRQMGLKHKITNRTRLKGKTIPIYNLKADVKM